MNFEAITPADRTAREPANLQATLVSLPAMRWLDRRPNAQVLHAFSRCVNLLAEDDEILSLTAEGIEPGPFSIVVEREAEHGLDGEGCFAGLETATTVKANASGLQIGRLNICVDRALFWDPRFEVGLLDEQPVKDGLNLIRSLIIRHAAKESLALALGSDDGSLYQRRIGQAWHKLRKGILSDEQGLCVEGAWLAAGVGIGLTPAGDDFLVGVLAGLWTGLADPDRYADSIVAGATPRTSKLSAAWITAAGRGAFGQVWHDLSLALLNRDQGSVLRAGRRILGTGHTSGTDAMSGFLATMELISHS